MYCVVLTIFSVMYPKVYPGITPSIGRSCICSCIGCQNVLSIRIIHNSRYIPPMVPVSFVGSTYIMYNTHIGANMIAMLTIIFIVVPKKENCASDGK